MLAALPFVLVSCGGGGGSGGGVDLAGSWVGTYSDSAGGSGTMVLTTPATGANDLSFFMGACAFGGATSWSSTGAHEFTATLTLGTVVFVMNGAAFANHIDGTFHFGSGGSACVGPMGTFSLDRITPATVPDEHPPAIVLFYDRLGNRIDPAKLRKPR